MQACCLIAIANLIYEAWLDGKKAVEIKEQKAKYDKNRNGSWARLNGPPNGGPNPFNPTIAQAELAENMGEMQIYVTTLGFWQNGRGIRLAVLAFMFSYVNFAFTYDTPTSSATASTQTAQPIEVTNITITNSFNTTNAAIPIQKHHNHKRRDKCQ